MAKCVVTRLLPGDALNRLQQEHDVEVWQGELPPTPDELRALVTGADGLLSLVTDRVDARLLDAAPRLSVIANYAVGYDNIDVTETSRRGITVTNTPEVLTDATADLAFTLLAASARHIVEADRFVRDARWRTWEPQLFLGARIWNAVLGVIGMGRIGSALADRARGYGMSVLSHGRTDDRAHLYEILEQSDFVSLHCPLTAESRHIIDREAIAHMKVGAVLVNTARGGLVDLEAVAEALHQGRLGGAAIDVADQEPIPMDHPIHNAPRAILTPHIGSATRSARVAMADLAVDNLLAVLGGRPPISPISPHGRAGMQTQLT